MTSLYSHKSLDCPFGKTLFLSISSNPTLDWVGVCVCACVRLILKQFKAKGNAALTAGNFTEAIEHYSKAINADGANHVYFSNRSAAYLSKGDAHNALEDAKSCLGLNPQFAKGYSRKGAALHALKRYNDSIAAYNAGLEKFPMDAGLQKGLQTVTKEKENPYGYSTNMGGGGAPPAGGVPLGGLFSPPMMAQLQLDPRMRPYLNNPDIMRKIALVQANPNLLPTVLGDPQMMECLSLIMRQGQDGEDDEDGGSSSSAPRSSPAAAPTSASKKKEEEKAQEMEVEEDWSTLSPEELKKKENEKAAKEKKQQGNDLYKAKNFDEALAAYDEAIAIDPGNMTYLSNKGAVYFTQKKWDECIQVCLEAVEVGKASRAPFEERAKVLTRCAKAYQKKGDLGKAIEMCNSAQLEHYDKTTQRLLKTMELEKKQADTMSYQDDAKAEEAKQRGNDLFRAQKWGEALGEYEEAVKRAPKNAAIRNNLSAALCKVMDFNGVRTSIVFY
jgi:stress-induced-phosphoprotein 1